MIYRRRGDMCRGYSQSSLVGAKTATLLLPAHLESRLSGSAERLALSLLLSPFFSLHIHPSILSPSAARRSPQLTLALPNPNLIHCLRSCRLSAETQDQLSLFPVSHSLSFTLFSLSLSLLLPYCSTSSMPDEAQNSETKKEQSVTECMWKISQRQLLFPSL